MALFGLRQPTGPFSEDPMLLGDPARAAMQNIVPQQPAGAFIFGRGGQRISQDDIAMRRRLAAQQMAGATDTSPVGHWTQGLARALGGVTGGLQMRRADKDAAANQEALQAQIVAALSGEGGSPEGGDPIAALLANPETQALGAQFLKARQPQQIEPVIRQQNNGDIIGINPLTGEEMFRRADPNPKPVLEWVRSVDPLTGEVTVTPFGPNGPMGAAPSALGSELPDGWTVDEGGGGSNVTSGFPGN